MSITPNAFTSISPTRPRALTAKRGPTTPYDNHLMQEMRPVYMKFQANSDTRLTDLLKNVTGEERTAMQELTEKLKMTLE